MAIQVGGIYDVPVPDMSIGYVVVLDYFPIYFVLDTPVPTAQESWSTT